MSRLKISENLFLEKNELNRLIKSVVDDGYKRLLSPMVTNFGIVRDSQNNSFKIVKNGTNIIVKAGLAFNKDLDAILNKEDKEIIIEGVTTVDTKKWIILSRAVTNLEDGVINLAADGSISGSGTKFTEVLRGQPNFPTRIAFDGNGEVLDSKINNRDFEVVNVTSDTQALIAGDFNAQSNLKYKVVGTFTPGFLPTEENKYIYEYDGYKIEIVTSDSKPILVSGEQFLIASLVYGVDDFVVNDERMYCMFNELKKESYNTISLNSIMQINKLSESNGTRFYEAIIDCAVRVTNYALEFVGNDIVFTINASNNTLLGNNYQFVDNSLNGWYVINKKTMKRLEVIKNVGNSLYVGGYSSEFESTSPDIIIVPPFDEMEFEVKLNNSVKVAAAPFYHRFSIEDGYVRLYFYCLKPTTTTNVSVYIKYRYIGSNAGFDSMVTHAFNLDGVSTTYTDGKFTLINTAVHNSFDESYNESYN